MSPSWDGLPLLPRIRRSRGAFERAGHAGLHELPHPGAEGESEARARSLELDDRPAHRLGADSSTPDYVYFNHSAHVNRGISCYSCHGEVNHMPVVYHAKPHSMAWCLECHRAPGEFPPPRRSDHQSGLETGGRESGGVRCEIRKPQGVTDDWSKKDHLTQQEIGLTLKQRWDIKPPTNCQGCHR